MTDPIHRKPREKQNNNDDNLNAILDQGDLSLRPGNEWLDEEDAIDRLLRNDGFDLPEAGQAADKYAIVEDISEDGFDDVSGFDQQSRAAQLETLQALAVEKDDRIAADAAEFIKAVQQAAFIADTGAEITGELTREDQGGKEIDEFVDDFVEPQNDRYVVEPVNPIKQPADTEASSREYQDDDFLLADLNITSDAGLSGMGIHPNIEEDGSGAKDAVAEKSIEEEVKADSYISATAEDIEPEQISAHHGAVINNTDALLNRFRSEQEKLLKEYENKIKKTAVFTYAALGFGIAALCAAIRLGWITYNAKTEVAKLTKLVAVITEDMGAGGGENAARQANSNNLSIEQLNEKVDELQEQWQVKSRSPTDRVTDEIMNVIAKQEALSKALEHLQTKIDVLEKRKSSEKYGAAADLLNNATPASAAKAETINNSTDIQNTRTKRAAVKKSLRPLAKTAPVKKQAEKLKKHTLARTGR
ncbi:hypothetical protein METHB2_30046 [Candidatus Methylobacter favarea]|uniref:Uncharacterized protein n=1 Tax=Candidatus Methylobacter favarea TaxID=2707345 RepID=A0A8S0XSK8_9GAMM|nr:hypothetical protein [Candidatus Methylobacter favarea]CAA9890842.1 hypothetical protein METHB2_30046 [Candidatus Methylobacter favarea]